MGPDGKKKLSKRDGAKDILEYRAEGYLPEALVNFLALLGWHPSDDTEVMSLNELQKKFDITHIQKGGAKLDDAKLKWINHEHLKRLSDAQYEKRLREFSKKDFDLRLVPLIKERAQTLAEAEALVGEYDFMQSVSCDPALLLNKGKITPAEASEHLRALEALLAQVGDEDFIAERVKEVVMPYADQAGRGAVLWPLRVALSGREKSPDPFTIAALVGKTESLSRIAGARKSL
jgi:glutamyl/glutaminyl-tRNA synthetase